MRVVDRNHRSEPGRADPREPPALVDDHRGPADHKARRSVRDEQATIASMRDVKSVSGHIPEFGVPLGLKSEWRERDPVPFKIQRCALEYQLHAHCDRHIGHGRGERHVVDSCVRINREPHAFVDEQPVEWERRAVGRKARVGEVCRLVELLHPGGWCACSGLRRVTTAPPSGTARLRGIASRLSFSAWAWCDQTDLGELLERVDHRARAWERGNLGRGEHYGRQGRAVLAVLGRGNGGYR